MPGKKIPVRQLLAGRVRKEKMMIENEPWIIIELKIIKGLLDRNAEWNSNTLRPLCACG